MALPRKKNPSAEDWLIKPSGPRSDDAAPTHSPADFVPDEEEPKESQSRDESIGPETAQWIVKPGARPNGRGSKGQDAARAEEKPKEEPTKKAPSQDSKELAEAQRDLAKARKELEETRGERSDLEDRVTKLEGDLKQKTATESSGKRGDSKKVRQAKETLEEQREANADLAKRIRDLQTELRMQVKEAKASAAEAVKAAEAEAKKRIRDAKADLEQRATQMEAELTKQFKAREGELRDRIKELESALAEARKRARTKKTTTKRRTTESKAATPARARSKPRTKRAAPKNGELDLNSATFEELRGLGLSVTQSARVIAYRDVRGGYKSLDELDDIPGLSKDTRADLRARFTLVG